ncbi:MAG TPA: TldD/PmbA family protein, partial [Dehalococcoidia bacterium]|nr:TldD/PmbA family protein [Dehalococcoidia bacterium]
ADIRIEVGEGKVTIAENGNDKYSGDDYGFSFGIRVLAGDGVVAPGYYGRSLGASDLPDLAKILKEGLRHAHRRALANAREKAAARGRFGPLGDALESTRLAPIAVHRDIVPAEYRIDPRSVDLEEMVRYVTDISKAVGAFDPTIRFNYLSAFTLLTRELFCSSEGASIDQSFATSQGVCFIVAATDDGVSQEIYDYIGHQRGWEIVAQGHDDGLLRNLDFRTFSLALARDAVDLVHADPLPATEGEVTVVTDPHYNALLVHEIIGHPMELYRALKMETAYAGRTWLFKDLDQNQIGRQIASPLVNAYSDPALPGYGHYRYDHEGTPARRASHIENGVFQGFMNSRQTAAILGVEPNGSYKATEASLVPLIRMSNTVFGPGESDPEWLIKDVDHGYYLVGHRIPSIAESRENFRITAQKVYEIRNGEVGKLYRNGGIMADSRDFLMQIDGVGTDFRLFPIPNCGKGAPMQVKKLGNGGPTMRSRARLTGV